MFLDVENEENEGFGGKGLRQKNSSRTEQLLVSSFIYILLLHATGSTPHLSFPVSGYTYTQEVELTGSNSHKYFQVSFPLSFFPFPLSFSKYHRKCPTEDRKCFLKF